VGSPIVVDATDDVRAVTERLRQTMQGLVDRLQAEYPVDGAGAWWQPLALGGTAPSPQEAARADAERDRKRGGGAPR